MDLTLEQEAGYIEDLARSNRPAAIARLNTLLSRAHRLEGHDQATVMSFNAKLVTELRERGLRLFVTYIPPTTAWGQGLPCK